MEAKRKFNVPIEADLALYEAWLKYYIGVLNLTQFSDDAWRRLYIMRELAKMED